MKLNGKQNLQNSMVRDILAGLQKPQKEIPSKYFYDQRGSELFEQICNLDEYYPTSAEMAIMDLYIDEIADKLGQDIELIEFGSGSSRKTRLLLTNLNNIIAYVPVDISEGFLYKQAEMLKKEYPDIDIYPVAADYTKSIVLPEGVRSARKIVYFPGSTIGNFTRKKARKFLGKIARLVKPNGGLLVGVDMKKDVEILEAAYNDSKGITALFNKNLLIRLNRETDADFDPDKFEHNAFYNAEKGRIEMHLESLTDQAVEISGRQIQFTKGETIHTENSYKYSPEEFRNLASDYFEAEEMWTDPQLLFSVHYLRVK